MARRYSASQIKSMLRRAEQQQRKAISDYNSAVRKYNREAKKFVNDYNAAVRSHNARVNANRRRLKSELAKLSTQSTTTHTAVYRTSVRTVSDSYARLEARAEAGLGPEYNRVLDLSEREAANSVAVANRLLGEAPEAEEQDDLVDEGLLDQLRQVSPDLDARWKGAVFALNPNNPDAARHFCTSAREVFVQILEVSAPDKLVFAQQPNAETTDHGKPTRRAKLRYLLQRQGLADAALEDFAEADVSDILELFRVFNDGTHGSAGTFGLVQLSAIRKRVEDGIGYLVALAANA